MDLLIPSDSGVTISGLLAGAPAAQRLLANNMNPNCLRTNAVLRKEEWIQFDEILIEVATDRLVGVADLVSRGLTINIGNGLGTTVFQWEDMSDMTAAEIDMAGVTRGQKDRVTFDLNAIPLPIIHKDFSINIRALEASRKLGQALDTTQVAVATRLVSEQIENILFNGASALAYGGGVLRGYNDHPDRNTVTLAEDWDAAGKTGEEILLDVLAMKQALINDHMFGPYLIYIPVGYETKMDDDFKANSDRTIRERILAIESIVGVKVIDQQPANTVLMVALQRETISMVMGMQPTVVQWEGQGGMEQNFKVMAIMVPRIASDHTNQNGIVQLVA